MADLKVKYVFELATKALIGQGLPAAAAKTIAEEFVAAELAGVKTHGLGKLVSLNLGALDAKPAISGDGALLTVNGNGMNGFVLFSQVADLLIERCRAHGLGVAMVRNFSRYSSLYPYPAKVAKAGYVAVLSNTAGPAAVAPYGAVDPLTGTNPICFSFPTARGSEHSFDFSTSEKVWGAIRQAAIEGKALPQGTFFDAAGDVTTVPGDVNAVRVFGGTKGWALNLALEVVAGILSGGKAGLECESEFDCGAIFLAIDPNATGVGINQFQESIERLFASVRQCRPEDAASPVRVPGDRGRNLIAVDDVGDQGMAIPDAVVEMMKRMAEGQSITELASNPLFN